MDRRVVPYKAWHLRWLQELGAAEGGGLEFSEMQRWALQKEIGLTVFAGEQPVACGGVVKVWQGRYAAWAYLPQISAAHMLFVTRAALSLLGSVQGRIEMTVREGFAEGVRWARILGFEYEATYPKYGPDGALHFGYVRFN